MSATTPGGTGTVRTLARTKDHIFGALGPVMVVIWRVETSQAGVEDLRERLKGLGAEHPAGTGIFIVVEEDAPAPTSAVRRQLGQVLRDAPGARACTLIYEGTGIGAVIVRSVVATILLVIGNPYPYHIFSDVKSGAAWLCDKLPEAKLRPEALAAAITELRHPVK